MKNFKKLNPLHLMARTGSHEIFPRKSIGVRVGPMIKRAVLIMISLVLITAILYIYMPQMLVDPVIKVASPVKTVPKMKDLLEKKVFHKKDMTIVAVGDSLTKGVGDLERGGYVGYVQNHLEDKKGIDEVTVYNYGVKGDTTADLLKVLQSDDVLNQIEQADLILFTIGGNDVMEVVENHFLGMTLEMFKAQKKVFKNNLEKIFTILRSHNAKAQIIYIGMYNPFSVYFPKAEVDDRIVHMWSLAGKNIAMQYNHTDFVSTFDIFEGRTRALISGDRFHPNDRGYTLIGKRVMKAIEY
ncbi:MAG TPA: SGNH/GDSL hydrolase family protein [Bacillales bacterium]|nr:SGNH/GDSL hydrolase family protein [Bacillales bacterium]